MKIQSLMMKLLLSPHSYSLSNRVCITTGGGF
jgi:hypothetical protein